MNVMPHSTTIGGSSAARVLACPASMKLCASMPRSPDSDYSREGTALHSAVEFALQDGRLPFTSDTSSMIGRVFDGITLTAEHIDTCIDPALSMFDEVYDEYVEKSGEVEFVLEQKVKFPGIPKAFGTADLTLSAEHGVAILDWKFGRGVTVSAHESAQGMFYALGAVTTKTDGFPDDQPVEIIIVQPRIAEEPSRWVTNGARLKQFQTDLIAAYEEAIGDSPSYARGEHCRFCTAKPVCPQYKDVGQKLNALVAKKADPVVENFTPEDLAEWARQADIVEAWAKAVRQLMMQEAEAGRPPTGMKLVQKQANTSWVNDDPKAIDRMLARLGLGLDVRRQPWKNASPTQAKKALKKLGKELRDGVTQRLPGKPVLVPDDDPRPAIVTHEERVEKIGVALHDLEQD